MIFFFFSSNHFDFFFVKLVFWLLHPSEQLLLQRQNDKFGISFDARTLVTYNCNAMNPFHEKKGCCKKKKEKELIHIGIAPLSIKVSESRKSKSGLEKKTLLLFLSTTAFSNWRGKPSSAKHKLHPNGFCLYLLNSTKEKSNEISTNVVSFCLHYMYCILWTKVLLSTNGEKGVAWGVCLLQACFAEWRHR